MRDYVTRILSQSPDWEIRTAGNGLEALEAVNQRKPDLILSDVMMPVLDGFGLLKKLKESADTSRIPVVFLSARAGEEATIQGLEKGADDYLVKPFSARELITRVKTQLEITHTRQDNTQLRKAEEELKKFKIISDHAFDAFILMREDGTFAYLNDLTLKRWGYTREEAQRLRVPDVDPIYQEEKFNEVFALAQQLGPIPTFETIHKRKDGTIFPVEVSMGGITLDNKPHLFAVARDITERKVAEETLKKRNELLERTNNDLDNFIYTASHDLKAPISNIEGLLQALLRTLPPESMATERPQRITYLMQESVERFKRTIANLTEVVRLQKEYGAEASLVDLSEVVREVLLDLEPMIQHAGAQVEVNIADCPEIRFSAKNLRSVLYNLLSNGIKYRSPERMLQMQIHCVSTPEYYVLTVRDNGLGLEPGQVDKLFSMFKRFHDHVEGSGIGLYMIKRMVENAGGRIAVESRLGEGATFRVYFRR